MNDGSADVIVVGGGMIGLATAWRLAQKGVRVTILERDPEGAMPGAASEAAGGMLAPSAELQFEEVEFYNFQRESARRWPEFARQLQADSDVHVGHRSDGTLMVAIDRDDAEAYRRLYRFQKEQGLPVAWLSSGEAREVEPFLSPRIAGAIHAPDDHQVDNLAVMKALRAAVTRNDRTELRTGTEVIAVEPDADRPAVRTASGDRLEARVIVLAAGAWTNAIGGLPTPLPVRPVKGQMLSLAVEPPFGLNHVVRTPRAYLVPRSSGTLVVGATSEEMGFDIRVTGGGIYRLLEEAVDVVPGIEELQLIKTWAGLRPASRDHRPILGFGAAPGVVSATGHFRHGILLTPITADELAAEIATHLDGRIEHSAWLVPFAPRT